MMYGPDVLQALGSACFDWQKYVHHNKDLAAFPPPVLFQHFVFNGQFEGRQYRFLPDCKLDFERAVWKLTNNKLQLVETPDDPETPAQP